MKLLATIIAVILISCNNVEQDNAPHDTLGKNATSDTVEVMNELMRPVYESLLKVEQYQLTADFDYDYAYVTSELKRGVIHIAEIETVKGSNPDVRLLAQRIATRQAAQARNLDKIVAVYDVPTAADTTYKHRELESEITVMITEIKNLPVNGKTDHDFLQLMILHHNRAIAMTESELLHGTNKAIRRLAQKQLPEEKKELVELKNLLNLM